MHAARHAAARVGGRGAREEAQDVLTELSDALEMATRRRAAARLSGELIRDRRAVKVTIASEPRLVAVEDAARYRDALGMPLPLGLPESLLAPVRDPLGDLLMRYARSHGPFTAADVCGALRPRPLDRRARAAAAGRCRPTARRRFQAGRHRARMVRTGRARPDPPPLARQAAQPGGTGRARGARTSGHHVAGPDASPPQASTRSSTSSKRCKARRCPHRASSRRFCRRASRTISARTSTPCSPPGEVVWCGLEPLGERDGRVALYLTDHFLRLWRPRAPNHSTSPPPVRAARPSTSRRADAPLAPRVRSDVARLRSRRARTGDR